MSNSMSLKTQLSEGGELSAAMVNIPHPIVVEIMGSAGFDFVILDAEHSAFDRSSIQELIRAGDAVHTSTIVRVPRPDAFDWMESALDSGAAGVLFPRIDTAQQVRAAIRAMHYPPRGCRGSGPSRSARYGARIAEDIQNAHDRLVCAIMIETWEAVQNIDEILAVEGLDLILIGPNDLRLALSNANGAPPLEQAYEMISAACRARPTVCGAFVGDIGQLPEMRKQGMQSFVIASDLFALALSSRDALDRWRA